jgi:hypothetical protein
MKDKLTPRFRADHRYHREAFVAGPARRAMGEHLATPALKQDGTEFQIRASLSAVTTPPGLLIMCAIRPIRDEPQSE